MKKIFQIVLVYMLGLACVMSFVWRASSLDKNTSLSDNYIEDTYAYNY